MAAAIEPNGVCFSQWLYELFCVRDFRVGGVKHTDVFKSAFNPRSYYILFLINNNRAIGIFVALSCWNDYEICARTSGQFDEFLRYTISLARTAADNNKSPFCRAIFRLWLGGCRSGTDRQRK